MTLAASVAASEVLFDAALSVVFSAVVVLAVVVSPFSAELDSLSPEQPVSSAAAAITDINFNLLFFLYLFFLFIHHLIIIRCNIAFALCLK